MRLILLSGGSGRRLWPLSNDAHSKQFLKLLRDEEGEKVSMVQRVWSQLDNAGLAHNCLIATSKSQVEVLRRQLGNVPLVVEPERRDTFPAIALSAAYLYSVQQVDLDEIVTVCPVDPFVEDDFFNRFSDLTRAFNDKNTELALIGVEPTYPSSKYGYIISEREEAHHDYMKVSRFKEKPTEEAAEALIESGALWNCGVFAFRLSYIIHYLEERGFSTNYYELANNYNELPLISFDYEIVEKAKEIAVYPYSGYWKDLGTWNTLTEEMPDCISGMGAISESSKNNHIINQLSIPVVLNGLNNVIVASGPDGILVTDKSRSAHIKNIINDFTQRPMYGEKRWGTYRVFEYTKHDEQNEVLVRKVTVLEGYNLSYHYHHNRSETWTIVMGVGEMVIEGEKRVVQAGDVITIPHLTTHSVRAMTDLEFIEVQQGSKLDQDDITRITYSWKDL